MHRVCDVCAHIWPGSDAASSKHNISISKNENNNHCSRNQNKMKWNESRMGSVLSQGKWMNANWFLDTHMHSNGFVSFSDSTHENTLIIFLCTPIPRIYCIGSLLWCEYVCVKLANFSFAVGGARSRARKAIACKVFILHWNQNQGEIYRIIK